MKIVIDTNRIISALVKDSTTRSILFDRNFEFITSDYTLTEINEHKGELTAKTNLTGEELDVLLALIFEHIQIIPESDYKGSMKECSGIIDPDDKPLLAVAIASKAEGIWTHDSHFMNQKKVKVFTNIDMLKAGEKNNS